MRAIYERTMSNPVAREAAQKVAAREALARHREEQRLFEEERKAAAEAHANQVPPRVFNPVIYKKPKPRPKVCKLPPPPSGRHTVDYVARVVCWFHGISLEELFAKKRDKRMAHIRFAVYYWAKQLTPRSFPEIGRILNRDHTSVLHGVKNYQQSRKRIKDARLRDKSKPA